MTKEARVRRLRSSPATSGGDYVLYWIQTCRRLHRNHALDHALAAATELGKPLVVYEGLRRDEPWASRRFHRFVLEGMRDNARAAGRLGLSYWPYVETERRAERRLLARLAARAALVVTDDAPGLEVPARTRALLRRTGAPIVAVEGGSIVPLSLLGSPVSAAAHLRPRIHRAFAEAWSQRPSPRPRVSRTAGRRVAAPFEVFDAREIERLSGTLPVDASVPPVASTPGGSVAARARLRSFVAHRLRGYAEGRSRPAAPEAGHASGLSPYLRFGHISIEEVVEAVLAATGGWSPEELRFESRGRRAGFFTADPDVDAFLDEAVTWRDVGRHWLWHRGGDEESLERALPGWALASLGAHSGDRRTHLYSLEEWEAAATHDPLWNAAQRELVATGTIHGYLRMLWGKKVIEWSPSPAAAYRTLVHLNNKYALDGRDPNSYSGILWCFGLFDRPWAPERPVFGSVRYMSSENTARKFRLGPYLEYVAALTPVGHTKGPATNPPASTRRRAR
jgi:deoxyribodipyrimidine photo-lyase